MASHNFWETLWIFNLRVVPFRIASVDSSQMGKQSPREGNVLGQRCSQLVAGQAQGQVPGQAVAGRCGDSWTRPFPGAWVSGGENLLFLGH